MGMFKKKTKPGQYSMMTEEYKPAALPETPSSQGRAPDHTPFPMPWLHS